MRANFVFGLETAGWPALLVDGEGTIRLANAAAVAAFGPIVEGAPALGESIWPAEGELSVAQFLTQIERSAGGIHPIRLRSKGGRIVEFHSLMSWGTAEGRKLVLLQLFPSGQAPAVSPGAASPAPEAAADETPKSIDAGLALRQKLDCALQLARTVASDFNNALTSILGHTSLILSRMNAADPWRASLVEVEKSAEKAAEIASDLAAFSRRERDPATQQAANLNELIRRSVEVFRTSASTHVTWQMALEPRLYAAYFDEAKLQQAVVKLIDNAVQALEGRPGTVWVRTRNHDVKEVQQDEAATLQPGCYVCVEIEDTGIGIPLEVMPRIFEPFFTTKKPPHRGLGLTWVYGIATNHKGSVAVSSPPLSGTSVRLYLPAIQRHLRDRGGKTSELRGTETLLMVDDEDLLLTMGETVLSAYGYRVFTANSGRKALDIFTQNSGRIDLVITDLVMPGMSGRELAEQLRRIAPTVRIVCSSGYVRAARPHERELFLRKPFTSQELLALVRHALSEPPDSEPT